MTPLLFDPRDPPAGVWPEDASTERAYIEAIAIAGVPAMVANVSTDWWALRSRDRVFPVTVDHGEIGGSYVCLPHSAYALYAREELDLVHLGALARGLARPAISVIGALLRAANINRIVHVDNWLLSTNLHGSWDGADLPAIRVLLATRFPNHYLAIRSIDRWSCPALLEAARADGWTLVPSRQIWVTDDPGDEWRARNAFGNDRRLLRRSGYVVEPLKQMTAVDAATIADLYRQLYIAKYSSLNPVFTPAFVSMTHRSEIFHYRVVRGPDGAIRAVAGSYVRDGILTPPIVGYDTSLPQREGLYRIASLIFADEARRRGVRLNGSAGAAGFKRLRGARGMIEYTAIYARHLSPARRFAVSALATLLERVAVPIMRRKGL